MSEEATPPQADTEPQAPAAADPAPDAEARVKELEKRLRDQGRLQRELESLKSTLAQREDADKTEAEKAAARIAELEKGLSAREEAVRKAMVRAEAIDAASRLGFRNPEDGLRFLDVDALDYDDDGRPLGVEKQLAGVLKERDYLKAAPRTPDAGQGDRGRSASLTVAEVRKMTADEINSRWDEVSQALGAAGR